MGQKNELGIDLFNAVYQGAYELEYKRTLNKHAGLILSAGYYASKKNYEDRPIEGDPVSSLTTGPTFGVGFGYNRERLGMAYPVGWCMSYGYKLSLLKIEDRYEGSGEKFDHTVHQIYLRCSRTYNFNENFNVQLSVRMGNMVSRVTPEGEVGDELEKRPLRVLPAKHPFAESGTYQFQKFPKNEFQFRFFIMPVIRVAHLF